MEVGKSQELQSRSATGDPGELAPSPRLAGSRGRKSQYFSSRPKAEKTNISVGRPLGRRNSPLRGEWMCGEGGRRGFSLFVLFGASPDLMRPTHVRKGDLLSSLPI